MGLLSRHLGEPEFIEIGEDKIPIKPLGTEDLPLFFKAMKSFSGASDENAKPEDTLKNITDEGLDAVRKLIDKTLAMSMPEEPETDRKIFGLKYMMLIFPKIMSINMYQDKSSEKMKKLDALKKLQQQRREASNEPTGQNPQ